jgi:hypothetical protein
MSRLKRIALCLAAAICCGCAAPYQTISPVRSRLLGANFEHGTPLSYRVSEYLIEKQGYFMASALPVNTAWYTSGQGRAGFFYEADCETALRSAHAAFEYLAAEAPPDIAGQLRHATWREISEEEFGSGSIRGRHSECAMVVFGESEPIVRGSRQRHELSDFATGGGSWPLADSRYRANLSAMPADKTKPSPMLSDYAATRAEQAVLHGLGPAASILRARPPHHP